MNDKHCDIKDDEIRIISSGNSRPKNKRRTRVLVFLCGVAALLIIGGLAVKFMSPQENSADGVGQELHPSTNPATESAFVVRTDTVIDGIDLKMLTPHNATPTLAIGNAVLGDSTAILVVQAADIREDNGNIVGSFVVNGDLVSKSEAKAGFCSIINGEITVGVADATPMFEQSLISGGYFFRQYPLVVGGQIVENRPKGKALRKALAELDGRISVITSSDRVTYHDFSQALVDLGVRNAIALVGGDSYGAYTNSDGAKFTFGQVWSEEIDNVNYIVWR